MNDEGLIKFNALYPVCKLDSFLFFGYCWDDGSERSHPGIIPADTG